MRADGQKGQNTMHMGNIIKKLRQERGITQEELAEQMHVSPQSVSKWETNTTTPDIALLPKLAVYFGVTIDSLFSLTRDAYLTRITAMLRDEHTIAQGDFIWAEGYLTGLLEEDPGNSEARKRLIELYMHRVNRDTLAWGRICEEGILRDPMDVDLVKYLVQGREKRQERDRLIAFLTPLAEADRENYVVREELIEACIRNREFAKAEKLMQNTRPRPAYTLFRGDILLLQGDENAAVQTWLTLTESLQGQEKKDGGLAAWTYYQAAERLEKTGRYEDALMLYEASHRAAAGPKKPVDSLYARAFLYEKLSRLPEAVRMWEEIICALTGEYGITAGETIDWPKRELERLRKVL